MYIINLDSISRLVLEHIQVSVEFTMLLCYSLFFPGGEKETPVF